MLPLKDISYWNKNVRKFPVISLMNHISANKLQYQIKYHFLLLKQCLSKNLE